MNVVDLATQPASAREEAARLLVEDFDGPLGWPDMNSARAEVTRVLSEGFASAMVDSQTLVGWVGGHPQTMGACGNSIQWWSVRAFGGEE